MGDDESQPPASPPSVDPPDPPTIDYARLLPLRNQRRDPNPAVAAFIIMAAGLTALTSAFVATRHGLLVAVFLVLVSVGCFGGAIFAALTAVPTSLAREGAPGGKLATAALIGSVLGLLLLFGGCCVFFGHR